MPGNDFIEQGQITACLQGREFWVCADFDTHKDGKEWVHSPFQIINGDTFYKYYHEYWENFHYFGLPQGKGSDAEPRWLIDFIKFFENLFASVEAWRIENRRKVR